MKAPEIENGLARAFAYAFAFAILVGCSRISDDIGDRAVVSDEVIFSPRSDPSIRNDFSFRLVGLDGRKVEREKPAFWTDSHPDALVPPGEHKFTVSVAPVARLVDTVPKEITFAAVVRTKKHYVISGTPNAPTLVEIQKKPNASPTTSRTK